MEDFGGTIVECTSDEEKPDKPDGWFLKVIDLGESFIRVSGEWVNINLGFAFIKATKSGEETTDINGDATVTFNTGFPDTDYCIQFGINGDAGNDKLVAAFANNKTVDGFDVITRDKNGHAVGNIHVCWLATRYFNP